MSFIKLFEQWNDQNFYLIIDDYSKLFNNNDFINNGLLKVSGISENKDINKYLGSYCDVYLIMDKNDVLKSNKLTKIDYNDPKMLCENNFFILKRILSSKWYTTELSSILKNNKDINDFDTLYRYNNKHIFVDDIYEYILELSSSYKHEQEWLVRNSLKVPIGTKIYIFEDSIIDQVDEENYHEIKEELDLVVQKLHRKYNFSFTESEVFYK